MTDLFSPARLGSIALGNRVVMAPMTRSRSDPDGTPTDIMVDYYRQRASAGLVIAEGTYPSENGKGYCRTPGIVNRGIMFCSLKDDRERSQGEIVRSLKGKLAAVAGIKAYPVAFLLDAKGVVQWEGVFQKNHFAEIRERIVQLIGNKRMPQE